LRCIQQNIMAAEQQQLLREIDKPIKERAFNPATFTSMTRAEAMRAFAFNTIAPPTWTKQRKQQARDHMSKLMDERRIAFDSGKSVAPAGVHINDRRRNNAGTSRGQTARDRGFEKWTLGCVGRSENGE
jgi:hypothetical protein